MTRMPVSAIGHEGRTTNGYAHYHETGAFARTAMFFLSRRPSAHLEITLRHWRGVADRLEIGSGVAAMSLQTFGSTSKRNRVRCIITLV